MFVLDGATLSSMRSPHPSLRRWLARGALAALLVSAPVSGCATAEGIVSSSDALCSRATCAASEGETCAAMFATSCGAFVSFLNAAFVDAAAACLAPSTENRCTAARVSNCLASPSGLEPTAAQAQLASAYCAKCAPDEPAEACASALYRKNGDVTPIGKLILPFSDIVATNVTKSCIDSKVTADQAAGCQATFPECAQGILAQTFTGSNVPEDTLECTLDTIVHGTVPDEPDDEDGGTPAGGCDITSCEGCCDSRGQCVKGDTDRACGTAGRACAVCDQERTCSEGTCVDASCKLTCEGCCAPNGACDPGIAAAACGSDGASCVNCGRGRTCENRTCVADGDSRWNIIVVRGRFPGKKANGSAWDPFNGAPDPYVQLTVGGATGQTRVWNDSLTPEWNERALAEVPARDILAGVRIEAWDDDLLNPRDFMGRCEVTIPHAMFDGADHNVQCPAAEGGVAFSLVFRFEPR